jgi:hypothetical protein
MFIFQNINKYYIIYYAIKPKNVVVEWKYETKMDLSVNHALKNNDMHKGISKFQNLGVIHNDRKLKDM